MSPTEASFSRGTVSRSRGARRYFLPAIEAMIYCDGCVRMRLSACAVEDGVGAAAACECSARTAGGNRFFTARKSK